MLVWEILKAIAAIFERPYETEDGERVSHLNSPDYPLEEVKEIEVSFMVASSGNVVVNSIVEFYRDGTTVEDYYERSYDIDYDAYWVS